MFSIGICDDEKLHREHMRELCRRFFTENPQPYELIEFTSGEEVLAYHSGKADDSGKLHLLFLDIEMDGVDGLEVLRKVEETDWIWRIVFVSSHEEAVFDTFSIKTLAFVRKPVDYHLVEKWIHVAIRQNKENVALEYATGKHKVYIELENIYYLESAGNYTYLHTKAESELVNENLKQWQKKSEQLPLVRIHKSYIINMLHVHKWEADKVRLVNGAELTVGRQYAKEAKEKYLTFVKKQALGKV